MTRKRTKECPNCGQKTVAEDKWSSCQWCHWPLSARHSPAIEQRKYALGISTRGWVAVCVVGVIILYWIILFRYSDWNVTALQQLIVEQWRTLLLWMGLVLGIALIVFFSYLAASTRPEFTFGVLAVLAIVLLISSYKDTLLHSYISKWVAAGG